MKSLLLCIFSITILATGCGPQTVWVKSGSNRQQFDADKLQCKIEARKVRREEERHMYESNRDPTVYHRGRYTANANSIDYTGETYQKQSPTNIYLAAVESMNLAEIESDWFKSCMIGRDYYQEVVQKQTSTAPEAIPVGSPINSPSASSARVSLPKEKKVRVGIRWRNLPPEQQAELGKYAGALITLVKENSPAFNANLMVGDILVEVDGYPVKDGRHLKELVKEFGEKNSFLFKIKRNGEEMRIRVEAPE